MTTYESITADLVSIGLRSPRVHQEIIETRDVINKVNESLAQVQREFEDIRERLVQHTMFIQSFTESSKVRLEEGTVSKEAHEQELAFLNKLNKEFSEQAEHLQTLITCKRHRQTILREYVVELFNRTMV